MSDVSAIMNQPAVAAIAEGAKKIPATDMSKQLLDQFFGSGWNKIVDSVSGQTDSVFLIQDILRAINTTAMTIATFLLVIYTMYGIIGTAHEGKVLGQKFHTIWAPVRSAIAISFLAPIINGLCVLQVLILLSIGYSVSFANTLWSAGLDFMGKNNGKVVAIQPADTYASFNKVADYMLYTAAVQQYMIYFQDKGITGVSSFCNVEWVQSGKEEFVDLQDNTHDLEEMTTVSKTDGKWLITFNLPQILPGDADTPYGRWKNEVVASLKNAKEYGGAGLDETDLGRIVISAKSEDDPVAKARKDACVDAYNAINLIVSKAIAAKEAGKRYNGSRGDIINIVAAYEAAVKPVISQVGDVTSPDFEESLENFITDAKSNGWIFAGSYYWTVSRFAERQSDIVKGKPEFQRPNKKDIGEYFEPGGRYSGEFRGIIDHIILNYSSQALDIIDKAELAKAGGDADPGNEIKKMLELTWSDNVINFFVKHMAAEGDIIGNMASVGHYVINAALMIPATQALLTASAAFADGVGNGIISQVVTGGLAGGATSVAKALVNELGSYMIALFLPLMILGFFLAFYLPTLPFIAWFSAVIGWVILCLESLYAAPFWAISHAIPEGEGIAGTHGRQGYMLLLAVLVRPPLMVAGFFSALILAGVVGKLLAASFVVFQAGMNAEHSGPMTVIPMVFIFGSICIVITHKIFKLITHLPDTVTKWIGQQVQNLGEDQDEARIRGAASTATTTMANAASSGMGGAMRGRGSGGGGGKEPSDPGGGKTKSTAESQHYPGETVGKKGGSSDFE